VHVVVRSIDRGARRVAVQRAACWFVMLLAIEMSRLASRLTEDPDPLSASDFRKAIYAAAFCGVGYLTHRLIAALSAKLIGSGISLAW